jgi:hypothetical protein
MLKYVGNGSLAGIPARDLTDDEVKKFGEAFLLATGLYAKVEVKQVKAAHENKLVQPDNENKGCENC